MKSTLYRQLEQYCSFGPYPFHMPGHKRSLGPVEGLPYEWDVTEVEGTDDLHQAEGILQQAMDRTARVFGAERTWYLVGGSTCGLLSGIRALAPAGSEIIVARNCHKSVYHAIELGGLRPHWLMPPMLDCGICGSIPPQMVAEAVEKYPDSACVILTSPTYEGILSDIAAISPICHGRKIPLLVDEAHGAHLGFSEDWPDSAVHLGADLVVQSVHKTLPSLTQTALLHLGKGSLADPEEVERQLAVFETSSPSYPLLVSIDGCSQLIKEQGGALFPAWRQRLRNFDRETEKLRHLQILGHGFGENGRIFAFDPGKIPILTENTELSGTALAEILRKDYGIETEMSQGNLCLAMTGMGDSDRAMEHLAHALLEIDNRLCFREAKRLLTLPAPGTFFCRSSQAVLKQREEIPLSQAAGRVSGETVFAYPPGIPLTVPGEILSENMLETVLALEDSGTVLHHSVCRTEGKITVLRE